MAVAEVRRISPQPLTAEAWSPFGWLPVADTDPADGVHRLAFAWDDAHVNIIGHRRDEVPSFAGGLRCEVLFRHATHTQVVMALDHDAFIVVAPAGIDPCHPDGWPQVVAFALPVQAPVVLHRGTWHWGPYPVSADSVRLFNVQGLRYAEDNDQADLAAGGRPVDVLLG
jgi:ureidoglycolate hydrolase